MSKPLKIIFAGTPEISRHILENLLTKGFQVDLVLTQPDRPKGRGNKITQSPVKELALANNIEVIQPQSFKAIDDSGIAAIEKIKSINPDIMIVVAYGIILPKSVLSIPLLGCVNIHVSLLPRLRGAAPIQRAVIEGDSTTGVTIMQMDIGLDTGDILLQREILIDKNDSSGDLHDKLAILGADMIVEYLNNYQSIKPVAQGDQGVTYAHKIEKAEAKINWNESASIIERKIRGYNPAPGAFSFLDNNLFKVWRAEISSSVNKKSLPGTIIEVTKDGIVVVCGENTAITITQLQVPGKTKQSARDYILGYPDIVGKVFKDQM